LTGGDRDLATIWGRNAIRERARTEDLRQSVVFDHCGARINRKAR
jgi:hypothetical protein